jgi:hypothetical protein
MKSIYLYILLAIASVSMLGSCKKTTATNKGKQDTTTTPVSPYTNPKTASVTNADYDVSDTAFTNHGWTKAYDEEFNTDLSNWGVMTGGMYLEQECNEPANVQIVNGVLQITAKKETVSGPKYVGNDTTATFNYTSGWLTSAYTFAANDATPKVRVVARVKVASGYGLTSLFWSYGDGAWPTQGEIDYLETQGNDTKVYATDYSYGPTVNVNIVSGGLLYNPTTVDLSAHYHVYVMEWTKTALTSYLDGKLVETKTAGGAISDLYGKQQRISFSLPIGGLYYADLKTANIQGGTMSIDYVKVFTSN